MVLVVAIVVVDTFLDRSLLCIFCIALDWARRMKKAWRGILKGRRVCGVLGDEKGGVAACVVIVRRKLERLLRTTLLW